MADWPERIYGVTEEWLVYYDHSQGYRLGHFVGNDLGSLKKEIAQAAVGLGVSHVSSMLKVRYRSLSRTGANVWCPMKANGR
jgi:hypothetical protein